MKIFQKIFFGISIIFFIGLSYISFFNVFQTDDYIYAATTRELGAFENALTFYKNWGGRFFSYSLNTLIPAGNPHFFWLPKILPVFYFVLLILGFYLNFKFYFKQKKLHALQNAFILFLFYTICLTEISEHYYWISGANIYLLPIILSQFLIYFFGKFKSKQWIRSLIFFLIILLMGSNEVVALYLILFLITNYLLNRNKDQLQLLLIGIPFFLLNFFAPGNFNRMGEKDGETLIKTAKRIAIFIANSGFVFLKLILIIPLFNKIFEKEITIVSEKISKKRISIFFAFSLVALMFLGGLMLFAYWRATENIIFYTLIIGSVLIYYFFPIAKKFFWISAIVIFLPSITLFTYKKNVIELNYNLYSITQEILITPLSKYEKEIKTRHLLLRTTKEKNVYLKPIINLPKVLYFQEIGTKTEPNYINKQLQLFYEKEGVFLVEEK